jgi:hypothetical protein
MFRAVRHSEKPSENTAWYLTLAVFDDPACSAPQGFPGSAGEGAEAAAAGVAAGAHEGEPGFEVDAEAVEDRGEVGGNGSALVASHEAAGLVDQG